MDLEETFRHSLYTSYGENKCILLPKDEYIKTVGELLIRKKPNQEHPLYFATIEETFDIIKRAHIATGQGGRDKMIKEINKKYANITQDAITLFKSKCIECQRKRKRTTTKGIVVKPILSKDFSSRAQVDLIDMQSMCHGQHKWIMVYQDHLTKFCILRPLTSKRASEVAYQLLDIYLLLGAPSILQSDNGSEFTAQVITELKQMWPDLVIVHGKPRHPQSQGSVERANCDIKDMLIAWMSDNDTRDWTVVQFQKNSSHHTGIKRSPFAALFGADAKVGLTSSSLPQDVTARLQTEDDLLSAVSHPNPVEQSSEEAEPVPVSPISVRQEEISLQRESARDAQFQQAERMVKRSRIVFSSVQIGSNVTVPIPSVDRGRADPRNIIGVVTECSDNKLYTIAVKGGILDRNYSRNQFDVCATTLYSPDDVCTDKDISLRQAVQLDSKCGGQGFTRCNCAGSKRCQTNRCKCFKARLVCNSRCHSSLPCINKNCC
ncbi:KRAB-A domain-containing protein 2-like [Gigantopelta aegis]|uniref:KRAB-A domain-containing protein 2-like n=1 Tax=Gigantopelta aegis TaxID=1735272 RepID=UPI001B88BA65|nr:KRAB-A domain-containing protein 2-like [Gigantopelta aegis]